MKIYSKVFMWMFVGLFITFITGYYGYTNGNILRFLYEKGGLLWIILAELAVVVILSLRIKKMKPTTAIMSFLLYSFLTGLTFSSIFIVYKLSSIIFVFLTAAVVFGIFSIIGFFTKIDLSKFGTFLMMMLVGIIVISLINMFVGNSGMDIIISIISLIVFIGFTAYDVQKIKYMGNSINENNLAILMALQLYLDFINIFIDLLRLFGKTND